VPTAPAVLLEEHLEVPGVPFDGAIPELDLDWKEPAGVF
jgi:hypothetical protein